MAYQPTPLFYYGLVDRAVRPLNTIRMKKTALIVVSAIIGFSVCSAGESTVPAITQATSASYSSQVSFPTGVYFNGRNFIKVESTWVRIYIGGQSSEYSINHAEIDPSGNYALVLEGGLSITIYSNGRSLYYNGSTYSKN